MKKICIVHRTQFGYHTDIYKWCEYLHTDYRIDLICFNEGRPKYTMNNVCVHYAYGKGSKIVRWICFISVCFIRLCGYGGVILVSHFSNSSLLKKVMPWRKMALDIRTFSVNPNDGIRNKENHKLYKSVRLYDYVTVISDGLRQQLPKSVDKTAVLPLGAEIIETRPKRFDRLDLLYVGTFFNRHLEETIKGFSLAKKQLKNIQLTYHIVGNGNHGEDDYLKALCKDLSIEDSVVFYGRQPHDQLTQYFEMCNIGVSYVPIVPYYDYQPVTKTFEYILAGLFTIATATKSNVEVINDCNGYLIEDNAQSFADAIMKVAKNRYSLNDNTIRNSLSAYRWEIIVNEKMKPIIKEIQRQFKM